MAPERLTVSRDARLKAAWDVRRRRQGDRRFLVRLNEIYELDELADTVWLACADGLRVREAVALVAREHGLPIADALGIALDGLGRFAHLGLVTFDAAEIEPTEPEDAR